MGTYKAFFTTNYLVVEVEYAKGKELFNVLMERKLHIRELIHIYRQIVSAISYMHSHSIYHRDLKLENIIVDEQNNVKIIDFGFCDVVGKEYKLFCGSLYYCAPEMVELGNIRNREEISKNVIKLKE